MKSQQIICCAVTCGMMMILLSLSTAEVQGPQTYGLCFQNITTDREEAGFIQVFGLSINKSNLIVQGDNTSFYKFDTIMMEGTGNIQSYNNTPSFTSNLRKPDPVSLLSPRVSNFGMIVSSDNPIGVFGIKSDKGTTDGYYAFPHTHLSTEFIIAGWPRIHERPFLALIMAIPVVDGTCVELFKIYNGDTYQRVAYEIVGKFQLFRYFAAYETFIDTDGTIKQNTSVGEDVTGMYLNSSKPVQVIFGHECAWVPTPDDLFCDYIAESIPPITQLGLIFIVPPILGRSPAAGYIVRVVPTQDNTAIKYLSNQVVTKRLGEFLQFDQPTADQSSVVTCDKPCLVYQYNKGYQTYNDIPTDPFMMMTVPVERFTAGAPFGTASFCLSKNELIEFNNYVSVVTYEAYKDDILYNNEPITDQMSQAAASPWVSIEINGIQYAVTAFMVTHGFHYVSMSAGKFGSFAVYSYGHSRDPDSSSGYGYFCNYNTTGIPVSNTFAEVLAEHQGVSDPDKNDTCTSEAWLLGSIISSNVGQYAPFPFRLRAGIEPGVPLTPECRSEYHDQLLQLLQDFSRKINYWICMSKNCTFLNGEGVAINYDTLSVEYFGTGNIYTSVEIYVEMIGSLDVTADNFATCRAEIQNYMYYFVNWPPQYTKDLLHQIVGSGCPWPIPFQEPKFVASPVVCPSYYD